MFTARLPVALVSAPAAHLETDDDPGDQDADNRPDKGEQDQHVVGDE